MNLDLNSEGFRQHPCVRPYSHPAGVTVRSRVTPSGTIWDLLWTRDDGDHVESYITEDEAEARARKLGLHIRAGLDLLEWEALKQSAAERGGSPLTLVKRGLCRVRESQVAKYDRQTPFGVVLDHMLAVVRANVGIKKSSLRNYERIAKKVKEKFGLYPLIEITAKLVAPYLATLPNRQGEPGKGKPASRNAYVSVILAAMDTAELCTDIQYEEVTHSAAQYYTIEQVTEILAAAPTRFRAAIALALFGFVRPEVLERLPESCFDYVRKTIILPSWATKDNKEHTLETEYRDAHGRWVPGLLGVLWRWLDAFPFRRVKWTTVQKFMKRHLGYWIFDGLRHTGATYFAALHGRCEASRMLTHSDTYLAGVYYLGAATQQDALRFLALTPDKIAFVPDRALIYTIPTPELERIIWLKPRHALAADLGCSPYAFASLLRSRGVEGPGIGYWRWRSSSQDRVVVKFD